VYPGSKFNGYGEKKEGTICISVSGDVMHPGDYYVPKTAGLYTLIMMMGLSAGQGIDGLNPIDAELTYVSPTGETARKTIRFAGYTDYDMEKFSLAQVTSCTVIPRHYPKPEKKNA
jgi:NADH:ubiquinone oxidoreductase subunit F (NADH-binding)